jgi:hypothetical protein
MFMFTWVSLLTSFNPIAKDIATKTCLITLNKLHKTLVTNVHEVSGQWIFHYLYIIAYNLYITLKNQ